MTLLTSFATCDDIRATLGVTPEELPDTVLASPIYLTKLQEALRKVSATLEAEFIALTPVTAKETRLSNLVKAYSAYFIGYDLFSTLPVFAPKTVKDQHAETQRILSPFVQLKDDLTYSTGYLRRTLQEAYADYKNIVIDDPVVRRLLSSVGLGVDPVTG